jgi:hypothetical protein
MMYHITNILCDNVLNNLIMYHIMKKLVTNNVLKCIYRCCTNQRRYLMNKHT